MSHIVNERTTGVVSFTLLDPDGNPVSGAVLTTATLSLYDVSSRAYINSRQALDAKNANDVTIDNNGLVTWRWTAADMAMHVATHAREKRRAVFHFVWATGEFWHGVDFTVVNEFAV
jgi:hypothetical protein